MSEYQMPPTHDFSKGKIQELEEEVQQLNEGESLIKEYT